MEAIYQIIGTLLPFEAFEFTFMKNALLAILLLTPLLGFTSWNALAANILAYLEGRTPVEEWMCPNL